MHTILIIDDETSNIKILSAELKSDYNIIVAKSGQRGLDAIETHKPDLVLLDIIMPEMDGFSVIKHIKSRPEIKDTPVIFISGLDGGKKEEFGLTLGAADYIYKPFSMPVVKARINNQLEVVKLKRELAKVKALLAKQS
ncbi:MAG: two-component system response regulator [Aestuariibacter sp.]